MANNDLSTSLSSLIKHSPSPRHRIVTQNQTIGKSLIDDPHTGTCKIHEDPRRLPNPEMTLSVDRTILQTSMKTPNGSALK